MHDIRHSHVSLLVDQGADPLLVARRVGHKRVTTTLETYSHLYPDKGAAMASALETLKEEHDLEELRRGDDPPDPDPDF